MNYYIIAKYYFIWYKYKDNVNKETLFHKINLSKIPRALKEHCLTTDLIIVIIIIFLESYFETLLTPYHILPY